MQGSLGTLAVICVVAALSPLLADLSGSLRLPAVVIEIVFGVIVGPQLLDVAKITSSIDTLAEIGLAMLMFLAGYEIQFAKVKGRPLKLASLGWLISLVVGLGAAGVLMVSDVVLSALYTGLAITTTALGTLLPILRDAGETTNRFGTYVLAAGSVGEFGPILCVSLLLTTQATGRVAAVLGVFGLILVVGMWFALRPTPMRVQRLIAGTLDASGQFAVRVCLLVVISLVWLAGQLGLDVLLGAFAAGVLVRVLLRGAHREHDDHDERVTHEVEQRLESVAFGFFVPLFFVVTGMRFDAAALFGNPSAMLRVPLFLGLFLLARGLPVLLYRHDLAREERVPFALLTSTQLPLVVVITQLGVAANRMRPATASALVGAAMLSVLIFPTVALAMRRRAARPVEVA